ncbi:hypothetical protein BJY52DRAFT_1217561 [Lactarius psammicola]|nr:hypothetical protein BJY52DRAFT_1217561 [Lactarius psammicola]
MPLSLPPLNAAIVCEDKELETYGVKQEGTSSLSGFIASEAGKQFKITYSNNLFDSELAIFLYIDGRLVRTVCAGAGSNSEFLGPYKSACSILPFKFQELQLVDPDLEDAPVAPEMGTIELRAYRWTRLGAQQESGVASCRVDPSSTGDEIPVRRHLPVVKVDYIDSWADPPHASIKVFYRPRELLRAQGIIPGNDVGRQGPPTNQHEACQRGLDRPDPPRSRPKIKREEPSEDAYEQRIPSSSGRAGCLEGCHAIQHIRQARSEVFFTDRRRTCRGGS